MRLFSIPNSHWLFVDDGSTDNTRRQLQELLEGLHIGSASLLSNHRNLGKGESIRCAVARLGDLGLTSDDVVGFIDADGAFPEDEVIRFVRNSRTFLSEPQNWYFGAVWSSRVALAGRSIRRRQYRHYLGRIIHTAIGARVPHIPYDTQCGLKLFRVTDTLLKELKMPFRTRWFFEVELIIRYKSKGSEIQIREEPLEAWTEIGGSSMKGRELLRVIVEVAKLVSQKWT